MKTIKAHRLTIIVAAIVVLVVLAAYYHFSLSAGPAQQILLARQNEAKLIEAVDKLYQDDQQVYPRLDLSEDDRQHIEDKIQQYSQQHSDKAQELQQAWQKYEDKMASLEAVQGMYQQAVVDQEGHFVNSKLKDKLNWEEVQEIDQQYTVNHQADAFQEGINQLISQAKHQVDLLRRSERELADLEHLPVTPEYQSILAKALNDIFVVLAELPSEPQKTDYQKQVNQRLNTLVQQVEADWPEEAREALIQAVPQLKDYLKEED
ncbi:hypothetical protein SAMN04488558_105118 [Ignavigranum ruoffiae]|uniref:MapZ extracellular domain-containing protein n=1 Tax=Ignavigranum ruoffiae TaxID=89093 RepID=A0A1H9DEV8_9LACT|nr:hypothetical protein [Ignavigranum ruoffiae]SEQ12052.1 hypothetical protein SAMN04488558_105118 [Ignavigranum ruoffiae]